MSVTALMISQKFVLIMRDITAVVRYNTLIKEERMKSDRMLASILPPSLVARVQAGGVQLVHLLPAFQYKKVLEPAVGRLKNVKVQKSTNTL